MINWKQKLSSRKFWALLIAQFTSVGILLGMDDNSIAQVAAIIGNFGSIVIYMLSEAKVDAARAGNESM